MRKAQISAGSLDPLAQRDDHAESGLAGLDQGAWFGLPAPAGRTRDIVAKLK